MIDTVHPNACETRETEREGESVEPDTAEGEGSSDAIRFVGVVRTRAAMVGEEVMRSGDRR